MFFTKRVVFQERGLISKRVSGSHTDLDKIQESSNDEPIVGPNFQLKIKRAIKETDIPITLPNRLDRGLHIPSHID